MTPRPFRVWLLAVAAGTFLPVVVIGQMPPTPEAPTLAPQQAGTAETIAPVDDDPVALKLSDAPLELVLQQIADWSGRTILRPQQLPTPTITINITKPIPKSEALRAVETLLNLNQIALVPMGDKFIKVVPLFQARSEATTMIEGSTLDLPPSGQVVTKLFQLDFLRVGEFLPQIQPLLNQQLGSPVPFEKANAVLVTDSISTMQRIELLLKKTDLPLMANMTPRFYTVRFAKASDLVNKIRAMFQGPLQLQLGTATSYSADDRTNQVVLIADPRQHAFFDELVAKLDVKSDPNTRNEVIYLKHAAAKDVASLLTQLVSGQATKAQGTGSVQPGLLPQPGPNQPATANLPAGLVGELGSTQFSSLVTVLADERSNAVVINGTVDDLRLIRELVDQIDIILAQVRIEVVIAEVTLSDRASTGISSLGLDVRGNKLLGFKGTAPGLNIEASSTSANIVPTDTGLLSPGFAATVGNISLVGIVSLSTTPRKGNSTIVSNPSITTTHNKEAKLFFGETRPVISGSTSSPTTTSGLSTSSTVTQQEIGTQLTVKPLIGNDGSVQLDIKQLISDVSGTVEVDGNTQYIIGKRETNSFITVKSGEIIVLGGMQKDNKTHSTSRLGPIPFIGDLLGARSRTQDRTELVVFIRPIVLTNTLADSEQALKQIDSMPGKDEIREKLDSNYKAPKRPFYQKHLQIP